MSTRWTQAAAVLLLAFALTPVAAAVAPPRTIEVGGSRLILQGHGTRTKFFFDLYSVALYLPHRFSDVRRIWDADVPKALVVEILYTGSLPDKIPRSWRQELLPGLTFEQKDAVAAAWATLSAGDTIRAIYAPDSGTRLLVDDRVVLAERDDALMRSFLDLWVGRSPVSRELRGSLLGD